MKKFLIVLTGIAVSVINFSPIKASAFAVNLVFDNSGIAPPGPDNPSPPYVGQGTLSFDGSYADGSYLFSSLNNVLFTAFIGNKLFDSSTMPVFYDPSLLLVINNGGSSVYFNGPSAAGPGSGAYSIYDPLDDLYLTFEPNFYSPAPYNFYIATTSLGTFGGVYGSVPAPAPVFGAVAAFGYSRKLRRRIKRAS